MKFSKKIVALVVSIALLVCGGIIAFLPEKEALVSEPLVSEPKVFTFVSEEADYSVEDRMIKKFIKDELVASQLLPVNARFEVTNDNMDFLLFSYEDGIVLVSKADLTVKLFTGAKEFLSCEESTGVPVVRLHNGVRAFVHWDEIIPINS